MCTVMKRSGKSEPFSAEKIRHSLALASDEAKQPLTEGDLSSLVKELTELLHEKTSITSYQVYVMMAGILCTRGFAGVLYCYMGHTSNAWR